MDWSSLVVQGADEHGVARVLLNRPGRGNALDSALFSELPKAMAALDSDDSVRVVILSGSGRHFCTGIDLSTLAGTLDNSSTAKSRERLRRRILAMQAAISSPEHCRKPVIALIHGACIGGGVDLAAACDLRYATQDATFSVREVELGITADLGSLQRLPAIIGHGRAMELALTAANFDATTALDIGFVSAVHPTVQELEAAVLKVARHIAAMPPLAVMGSKSMLLKSRHLSVDQGLDYIAAWNSSLLDPKEVAAAAMRRSKL